MKLSDLNTALRLLKTNLTSLQSNKGGQAAADTLNRFTDALNNTANAAKRAAGVRTQAERDVAREAARGSNQMMRDAIKAQNARVAAAKKSAAAVIGTEKNMAKVFAKLQADEAALAKKTAATIEGTDRHMAAVFGKLQQDKIAQARKAAEEQIKLNNMLARGAGKFVGGNAERARLAAIRAETQKLADKERDRRRAQAKYNRENILETDTLINRLRKVESQFDAVFRAGFRIQMVGNQMKQLGMNTLNFLGGLTEKFGEFEFMLNRAAGAMGIVQNAVGAGAGIYEKFQSVILDTANELRLFDPTDVAKATYYWASTSGQQITSLGELKSAMSAVVPLMKEAALTETSYETTIKGVYSILIQYNKKISDVADVTAKLQKATVETAAEFPDLINSFKMVGPIAAANNVSFEEMVGIFGRLADAGIRGSMAGRAFRQLFIQLVKPSEKAQTALDDLWASTKQFGGKSYAETVFPKGSFIGPIAYINELAMRTKDMTQVQRNAFLAQISTANELPVLTALVAQQTQVINKNTGSWDKNKKATETAAHAFDRQWNQLKTSWKGVTGAIKVGMDTIRIQLGGRIAEIFTPVMNKIIAQLGRLRKWIDDPKNSDLIDFFIKAATAAGTFLAALGSAAVVAGSMIALSAAVMVVIRAFKPLFGVAAGVIAVFAGLAKAVFDNFGYIQDAVRSAIGDINVALGGMSGGIEKVTGLFNTFAEVTGPLFNFIVRGVADLIRSLGSLIRIVSSFGPMGGILEVFAKIVFGLFAARTVASIVSTTVAMLGFRTATVAVTAATEGMVAVQSVGFFTKLASGLRSATLAMVIAQGATGKLSAAGGILRASLGALVSGPLSLVILAAVVAGLAYTAIPEFKGAVDGLIGSFKNWADEAANVHAQFGPLQADMDAAFSSLPQNTKDIEAQTAALQHYEATKNNLTVFGAPVTFGAFDPNDPWTAYKNATDKIAKAKIAFDNIMLSGTATLSREMDISLTDFTKKSLQIMNQYGVTGQEAADHATAGFRAVAKATKNGTSVIEELTKSYNSMIGPFTKKINLADYIESSLGGKSGVVQAKTDDAARELIRMYSKSIADASRHGFSGSVGTNLKSKMAELAADPSISPEIRDKLNEIVRSGIVGGVSDGMDAAEGDLPESAAERAIRIKETLLASFATFKDFDSEVEALLKKYIKPGSAWHGLLNSIMTGAISKLPKNVNPEAVKAIAEKVASINSVFEQEFEAAGGADSPGARKLAASKINSFTTWVKQSIKKDTPQPIKDALFSAMKRLYTVAGKTEVPQSVIDLIYGKGGVVPAAFGSGVTDGIDPDVTDPSKNVPVVAAGGTILTPQQIADIKKHGGLVPTTFKGGVTGGTPGVSTLAGILPSTASKYTGLTPTQIRDIKRHGQKVPTEYAGGMSTNLYEVNASANAIANASKKINKYGSSGYTWGSHLGSQYNSGLYAWFDNIGKTAGAIASTIWAYLHQTTAEKGPLKDTDKWGGHLVQNIVSGMQGMQNTAGLAAAGVAKTISDGLDFSSAYGSNGVSVESSASRLIKVQVEITSPDGSVGKMTTAQIESSIMTSDLILSLEHAATVG